jgi:hypothetical protein
MGAATAKRRGRRPSGMADGSSGDRGTADGSEVEPTADRADWNASPKQHRR